VRARARRCTVTDAPAGLGRADYASAFAVAIERGNGRSSEQWARAVFEQSPAVLRCVVLFGWKSVLWLRLGPRPSPDCVLGWTIRTTQPDITILEVQSWLLAAEKQIRVSGSEMRVTTFIRYKRWLGRLIWSVVRPVHHQTEPSLLTHATRR
jgi:hypothetical protein